MSDTIYELVIQIDSNQFARTDREGYIKFDDEKYGFIAPIIDGTAYLRVGDGLSQGGIPVDVLVYAFENGQVYFFSSIYDHVGRRLYDAPIWILYRTLDAYNYVDDDYYDESAWPFSYSNRYPWNYARGTIYGHRTMQRVSRKHFSKFPTHRQVHGNNRMRTSGSYGRFNMGNFSRSNRPTYVAQKSNSTRGGRRR